MNNTCVEVNDREKQSVGKKKGEKNSYDSTIVTLSWSNLIVGEINETASSTDSHSVTRPAHGAQLGCVWKIIPPLF